MYEKWNIRFYSEEVRDKIGKLPRGILVKYVHYSIIKKTNKIPKKELELAYKRLKEVKDE